MPCLDSRQYSWLTEMVREQPLLGEYFHSAAAERALHEDLAPDVWPPVAGCVHRRGRDRPGLLHAGDGSRVSRSGRQGLGSGGASAADWAPDHSRWQAGQPFPTIAWVCFWHIYGSGPMKRQVAGLGVRWRLHVARVVVRLGHISRSRGCRVAGFCGGLFGIYTGESEKFRHRVCNPATLRQVEPHLLNSIGLLPPFVPPLGVFDVGPKPCRGDRLPQVVLGLGPSLLGQGAVPVVRQGLNPCRQRVHSARPAAPVEPGEIDAAAPPERGDDSGDRCPMGAPGGQLILSPDRSQDFFAVPQGLGPELRGRDRVGAAVHRVHAVPKPPHFRAGSTFMICGYIRTSRAAVDGLAGMHPETQLQALAGAGVVPAFRPQSQSTS